MGEGIALCAHKSIIREGSFDWNRRIKLEVEITRESHKHLNNSYYAARQNNSLAPIQNGYPEHSGDHDVLVLHPMPDNFREPLTYYRDVLRKTSRDSEAQNATESNLKNLPNRHGNLQFGPDGACRLEGVEIVSRE
ncbi:Uncharacterized protein HZ326_27360 [Fusarium oxysporum f. sp. albedinis]|nr:Uncharacterized protein HZ326_31131 [Fusarium oxysporum f. sp. albedinis]KAJ0129552.1 Uncharacterized protein HZ326_27360 [Fusarium oxysporum f. sp. albedinis]